MDIDLAALRALERERDISLDVLIPAIEQALLVAYHRTEGAYRQARVELDRKTGHVIVWAREESRPPSPRRGERGRPSSAPSSTTPPRASAASPPRPRGRSSSSACATSRTRRSWATSRAARATSSPASSSRAPTRVTSRSTSARSRASCRLAEQVPGEKYVHGERLRCFVVSVKRGPEGPADQPVAHAPEPRAQALRARGARDRRRHASRSRPSPARPATAPRSPCTPPCPASTPRAPASARWAPRVRAVMTELHGEKIDIVDYSRGPADLRRQRALARRGWTSVEIVDPPAARARVIVPDYQLSLAIGKEGQNARLAAKLTGWRIDIRPDTVPAAGAAPRAPVSRPERADGEAPVARARSRRGTAGSGRPQ